MRPLCEGEKLMVIIALIGLIVLACFLAWKLRKLQEEHNNLLILQGEIEDKERQVQDANTTILQKQEALRGLENYIQQAQQEYHSAASQLSSIQQELMSTDRLLTQSRGDIEKQNALLLAAQNQYEAEKQLQEENLKQVISNAKEKASYIEKECQNKIAEKLSQTDKILAGLEADIESERQKYLSIIRTIQEAQPKEEKDLNRHIQINDMTKDDISYLLNNVAPHLNDSDILYKLIWSEFIQRPTNEMLDYILPRKDCAGIYKITNDRNQKSYIGRSTSVRKRLTDHIKSTVGIGTIADQRVHQIMREEGLWNFSFELIEECDKEKLNEREKYYIDFFQTAEITYGYNQKAGG